MSIEAISWVWRNSKHKGGALLLELALADFADDNGRAWPAIETLAKKARMTPRNVNYIIERVLIPAGGLTVKRNAVGKYRTNLYQLAINKGEILSGVKSFQDETHFLKGVKPISPNPSVNRHKSEKNSDEQNSSRLFPKKAEKTPPPIKTKSKRPASPAQLAAFAEFYHAYPLHKGRAPAEKAWLALNPDPQLTATIMAAVARYAEETANAEPGRIKYPQGWLNDRRWEDETGHRNAESRRETFING